jgi:hypothetical protein
MALPRAGTVVSSELYKSYPAAKALPLVGARPLGDRSCTWREGTASLVGDGAGCDGIAIGVGVALLLS